MDIHQILTQYWGHTAFRPMQEEIIQSVLEGNDSLALLPTGGGKSICFQVPAMAKEGICLVVSPLIALMNDQVQHLKSKGINAVAIVSGMHKREIDVLLDNCIYGKVKFLYVSPERLSNELFRARLQKMQINLIAVDEAHCISQWGYDFRPPYLKIAEVRELQPDVPVIALTATATPEVVVDIQEKLAFKAPNVFQKSFERKNLAYVVMEREDKLKQLVNILSKVEGSAVVYVRSRRKTKEVADYLNQINISASHYHAGLESKERNEKQALWIKGKFRVMVATNAFGMGIDKSNVRVVVHLDIPDAIESYFQEAGRAGRDGHKAYAVLIYHKSDQLDLEQRVAMAFPEIATIEKVYQALANHYQIAIGAGLDESYEFDIADFCQRTQLKPYTVYSSLKLLELDEYLLLSDAIHSPSRIKFLMSHNDLYAIQVSNKSIDGFIKLLLRSYSGLFDAFVKINEHELAQRSNSTPPQVRELLEVLDRHEVLSYIPASNQPKITYTRERANVQNLQISRRSYYDRKEGVVKRINAVIDYTTATHKCRSQQLLAYFGEKDALRCGICDVCLERNKLDLSSLEFEQVSDQIKALLQQEPMALTAIVSAIKDSRDDKIIKVIQWLVDNGKLQHTDDNKMSWKK